MNTDRECERRKMLRDEIAVFDWNEYWRSAKKCCQQLAQEYEKLELERETTKEKE